MFMAVGDNRLFNCFLITRGNDKRPLPWQLITRY